MLRWFLGALAVSVFVAASATAASANSSDDLSASGDRLVCKRYVETGSLAKMRKECHTKADWQKLAVAGRDQARDMVLKGINSERHVD